MSWSDKTHEGWRCLRRGLILGLGMACLAGSVLADTGVASEPPAYLQDAGIDQRIGDRVPMGLTFRDATGGDVELGDLFGDKPVILVPVYFRCPMLCGLVLDSLVKSLKTLTFDVGTDFDVIAFSFNPEESSLDAMTRLDDAVGRYDRPGTEAGWHFLTGNSEAVGSLTEAIGFRAALDEETGEFIHAASILLVAPDGTIVRYFYGMDYPPKNLRLGLVEAAENRLGNPVDQVLLYCYRYDPKTGKYTLLTMRLLRTGAILTVLGLGALITVLLRLEKSHPKPSEGVA